MFAYTWKWQLFYQSTKVWGCILWWQIITFSRNLENKKTMCALELSLTNIFWKEAFTQYITNLKLFLYSLICCCLFVCFDLGPRRNNLCTNETQNQKNIISLEGREWLGFVGLERFTSVFIWHKGSKIAVLWAVELLNHHTPSKSITLYGSHCSSKENLSPVQSCTVDVQQWVIMLSKEVTMKKEIIFLLFLLNSTGRETNKQTKKGGRGGGGKWVNKTDKSNFVLQRLL